MISILKNALKKPNIDTDLQFGSFARFSSDSDSESMEMLNSLLDFLRYLKENKETTNFEQIHENIMKRPEINRVEIIVVTFLCLGFKTFNS